MTWNEIIPRKLKSRNRYWHKFSCRDRDWDSLTRGLHVRQHKKQEVVTWIPPRLERFFCRSFPIHCLLIGSDEHLLSPHWLRADHICLADSFQSECWMRENPLLSFHPLTNVPRAAFILAQTPSLPRVSSGTPSLFSNVSAFYELLKPSPHRQDHEIILFSCCLMRSLCKFIQLKITI